MYSIEWTAKVSTFDLINDTEVDVSVQVSTKEINKVELASFTNLVRFDSIKLLNKASVLVGEQLFGMTAESTEIV